MKDTRDLDDAHQAAPEGDDEIPHLCSAPSEPEEEPQPASPSDLEDRPSVRMPIDETGWQPIDLRTVWDGLMKGLFDVIETFCLEERCFVVLKRARPEKRQEAHLFHRKLEMLERALLGIGQKVSAAEFGIAVSTVSFATRQALLFLGFRSVPAKLPLILVVLAHAARMESPQFGRESWAIRKGLECSIVSVGRPDRSLASQLPPSEYEVMRLFVEGRSHAEIARRRRTSLRTIANQLASVFHRLRISGRSELLNKVVGSRDAGPDKPS